MWMLLLVEQEIWWINFGVWMMLLVEQDGGGSSLLNVVIYCVESFISNAEKSYLQ